MKTKDEIREMIFNNSGYMDSVCELLADILNDENKKTCGCGDIIDLQGDRDYIYVNKEFHCAICMDFLEETDG